MNIKQNNIDIRSQFLSNIGLAVVLIVAIINHILTFFAYEWFPGGDHYSYDIAGLQLVTGKIFDVFPIMFRPPLVPILKNIFYLVFEGHPYALSLVLHILGILAVIIAYELGSRFHKIVGFAIGMIMVLNLEISVFYHSISAFTFYVPLLLLAGNCFAGWLEKTNIYSLMKLIFSVFACFLARTEAIMLIPIFSLIGWFGHRNWRQAASFFITTLLLYNLVCFVYYINFGYWGTTYKVGRSLFNRITRGIDQQFDINNGPASKKIYEYMSKWIPVEVSPDKLGREKLLSYSKDEVKKKKYLAEIEISDVPLIYRQMFTLNIAQRELGYIKADDLLRKASLEAIFSKPKKFIKNSLIRFCAHLGLYGPKGLGHEEYLLERAKFLYTTVGENINLKDMGDKHYYHRAWKPPPYNVPSPFKWERRVLAAKLGKFFGFQVKMPELPESFKMRPNVRFDSQGLHPLYLAGFGAMTERIRNCCDLDVYFSLIYWGPRWQSKTSLRILKYWHMLFIPKSNLLIFNYLIYILWLIGIFLAPKRWHRAVLLALLCFVLSQAVLQSTFSDNFGGRFSLYVRPLLWLGALGGIFALVNWLYVKYLNR